jgi:prepilin-type processing-associated H-X9-DG protein
MSQATQSRLSRTALVAFVLALSLVMALPALFLGFQAIRQINRSDGRLRGRPLAIAGLALSALVSILAILGLLAMVLLNAQEKSLETGCINNLRQIGMAVNRYSDHHDHYFPPGTVFNASLPPERRLSWQAAIAPFFSEVGPAGNDRKTLAEQIAFKEAWDSPTNAQLRQNVTTFLCPAFARELPPGQVGLTSYVGIAGVGDEAAVLPRTDANAGFFGYDRLLRAQDISARLDATMAAMETMQDNGPWLAGGAPTLRGVAADGSRYIGNGAAFGGLHRAGANVLWADSSVRPIIERINPELFRQQARINR